MENRSILAETPRLILRRYEKGDLQDLFEYLSDAEVVKYEPHKPMTLAEAERSLDWRIGTDEMIAVEWKDSRKMIGNVYLGKREFDSLEIGYVFNRNYWGKGCASESCRALIQQAFSAGIHRIYAECDPLNVRSWKLLEAIGFRREAHLIQNV
ncbi:MAG: GNAT family N-acetyltransferase, partial [Oscillospiraceae bacterium]|nr:GNAT family N-acetyltransferase [Oscillospiraceae bacterium]